MHLIMINFTWCNFFFKFDILPNLHLILLFITDFMVVLPESEKYLDLQLQVNKMAV